MSQENRPNPFSLLFIFLLVAAGANRIAVSEKSAPIQISRVEKILPTSPPKTPVVTISFQNPIHPDDFLGWSSPYGERDPEEVGGYGDDFHNGVDGFGVWLARIRPSAPGIVVVHFHPPGGRWKGHPVLGGYIVVRHYDRASETTWFTKYGHLAETFVQEGQIVDTETIIGRQGNTGRSLRDHLHFELHRGGECVIETGEIFESDEKNPLKYIDRGEITNI